MMVNWKACCFLLAWKAVFSNGPTYAEYIEELFIAAGLDTGNLALGGATAGPVNLNPIGPLSTFDGQVDTFVDALESNTGLPTKVLTGEFKPTGPAPGGNPLVSVLFGANDIFQGFDPIDAADFVAENIRSIGSIGGGAFNDFFVADLPLGVSPEFTAAAMMFNTQLADNIVELRGEGFFIIDFITQSVFNELLADIANGGPKYGITSVFPPCRESFTEPGPSCLDDGTDPNTILFNDTVHPNGVAHRVLGESAIVTIAAAIPTVGTLPLMLGALIAFGVIRHRRALKPLELATAA